MANRTVVRAVLVGGFVCTVLASCAKGNDIPGLGGGGSGAGGGAPITSSSSSSGSMPDAGPTGTIGSPCKGNMDCVEGTCAPIGNGAYCTQACPPACPQGSYCSLINGSPMCVPDLDQQCIRCTANTECKLPSDVCLTAPLGDKFCARDCTVDGLCPNGFTCLDQTAYNADGGAPDAGAGDGGATSGMPFKWCVPNSGFSCPCNDKRDGVTHACSVKNASGTCAGTETCNGAQGKWEGCTAATPIAEACNGKDDDCNGMIDDGDPNALCASEGPKPPHANWSCKNAACALGACDPGWVQFPAGPASAGCGCQLETGEPNGNCGSATPAGMVTDTGAPITVSGTLSSAVDVDVWTFDAVDVDEGTTNSYHVAINFTAPSPNDEFIMDVIRGDPCTDAPAGPSVAITAYDWCVNGFDGTTGELNCGPTAAAHCGGSLTDPNSTTHTAKYYVRVYRKPGATASCTAYTLTISGGGGECDLTKKCP